MNATASTTAATLSAERARVDSFGRLEDGLRQGEQPWHHWGPYLSERAWGTVREDYSEHGTAWDYFPHDHARSRAYRWNEDGLAGICDDRQTLLLRARALERRATRSSRSGSSAWPATEGNHGEDAKEYWWYLDSTPTHSWMRWRYHYPQAAFPYDELVAVNGRRGRRRARVRAGRHRRLRRRPVLGGRPSTTPRPSPTDMCIAITRRPTAARTRRPLHVLPTLWFRNTWSWGLPGRDRVPRSAARRRRAASAEHRIARPARAAPGDGAPDAAAVCDNETNAAAAVGRWPAARPYPKDGINDHVVARRRRRSTRPAPAPRRALHYRARRAGRRRDRRDPAAAAPGRRRRRRPRAGPRRGLRRGHAPRGGPRPTSSSPS